MSPSPRRASMVPVGTPSQPRAAHVVRATTCSASSFSADAGGSRPSVAWGASSATRARRSTTATCELAPASPLPANETRSSPWPAGPKSAPGTTKCARPAAVGRCAAERPARLVRERQGQVGCRRGETVVLRRRHDLDRARLVVERQCRPLWIEAERHRREREIDRKIDPRSVDEVAHRWTVPRRLEVHDVAPRGESEADAESRRAVGSHDGARVAVEPGHRRRGVAASLRLHG